MTYYSDIAIQTHERCHWVDITAEVEQVAGKSGIKTGICMVSSLHTTAGITVNENADPTVGRDVFWKLEKLFPKSEGYHHSEGNSDSHLKASVIGLSASVPMKNGELVLGTWQAIYFCEFDGPRNRRASVTIIGD